MRAEAGGVGFETTLWVTVREAGKGGSTALNRLMGRYRSPIVSFLEQNAISREDAEDLAQEVLLLFSESPILRGADPSRGRFRNLVVAVTRNVMRMYLRAGRTIKRGGRHRRLSLAFLEGKGAESLQVDTGNDEQFDHGWMNHLLQLSLQRLQKEHPSFHQAIDLRLHHRCSFEEIGRRMGKSRNAAEYAVQQARQHLARYLRAEIAFYSSSPHEYEEETAYLSRFLGSPA